MCIYILHRKLYSSVVWFWGTIRAILFLLVLRFVFYLGRSIITALSFIITDCFSIPTVEITSCLKSLLHFIQTTYLCLASIYCMQKISIHWLR